MSTPKQIKYRGRVYKQAAPDINVQVSYTAVFDMPDPGSLVNSKAVADAFIDYVKDLHRMGELTKALKVKKLK